VIERAFVER